MVGGEAKEHAEPRLWAPLGNLLAVLHPGIKNVYWATEDLGASEVFAGGGSLAEDLNGGWTILLGSMVP